MYYERFYIRFNVGERTTNWQRLEKGIITGCTISVIIFASAVNLIVKSAEKECKGPLMRSGIRQPPVKAFMDDLTLATQFTVQTRCLLKSLEVLIKWARMKFNPKKSRTLVIKKGKVLKNCAFKISDERIPTVREAPVKSLGKMFDDPLKDGNNKLSVIAQIEKWVLSVDESELPVKFKVWIFQHGILPHILWPLMLYDFPLSTVEKMESKISNRLRQWLGVPPSFSNAGHCGKVKGQIKVTP